MSYQTLCRFEDQLLKYVPELYVRWLFVQNVPVCIFFKNVELPEFRNVLLNFPNLEMIST